MSKPDPFMTDDENPELSDAQLAALRPAAEVLGEDFLRAQARRWRPIEEAPFIRNRFGPQDTDTTVELDDWYLLAREDEHGWVIWVGTLDADQWIGRDESRGCWECETPPTHFMQLASPPR